MSKNSMRDYWEKKEKENKRLDKIKSRHMGLQSIPAKEGEEAGSKTPDNSISSVSEES